MGGGEDQLTSDVEAPQPIYVYIRMECLGPLDQQPVILHLHCEMEADDSVDETVFFSSSLQ